MRIALIVPGGVDPSGERRVIPALLAYLRRLTRQHDVEVIALLQEDTMGQWQLEGARVHNVGRPRTAWRALRTVVALHRAARFDLVHAFWCGSAGLVASLAARLCGIPSLIHVAGGELAAVPEVGYGTALTWRGRWREPRVLKSVSLVTAASAPVLNCLAQHGITAQRVPLGVDVELWPPRAPRPRDPTDALRLIHVASLNAVKDQTTLLQALALVQRRGLAFTLQVVGEDTLKGRIQALAQQLGLAPHVHFHGFLTQAQMRPWLEGADVLVHTSRHETGPLVVLEAAVAGVPTVGTAVGHIAEWAPSAALAVAPGDADGIATQLERLAADEALRLRLAHQAQRRALIEDADFTVHAFQSLYEALRAR